MSHFITYYECGEHVYTQCRCSSPNKTKKVSNKPCPFRHDEPEPPTGCKSCAHKDHRWDEMRHNRDAILDSLEDLLQERPERVVDDGDEYVIAVPWRNRLRAILADNQRRL